MKFGGAIVLIVILAGIFLSLAYFSNEKTLSQVKELGEDLKKPKPIDSLTLPLPPSENESGYEIRPDGKLKVEDREEIQKSAGGSSSYAAFASECGSQGGGVVTVVNTSGVTLSCYQLAPDAGQSCRTDADCGSFNCNLHAGIENGNCALIKTDKYFENQTYIYTYNCSSSTPGICGDLPRNMPEYYWIEEKVIEYGEQAFPNEENEFKPV